MPVLGTVRAIWLNFMRGLVAFPVVWIASFVVHGTLSFFYIKIENDFTFIGGVLQTLVAIAAGAILAPAAMLTHRFILLGRHEPLRDIVGNRHRLVLYIVLEASVIAPLMAFLWMGNRLLSHGDSTNGTVFLVIIGSLLVVLLTALWFMLRAAACFPAIALDATRDHLSRYWALTRGRVWQLAAITMLSPFGIASLTWLTFSLLRAAMEIDSDASDNIVFALWSLVIAYTWVIVMSHVYRVLVQDTATPPDPNVIR